MRLFKVYSSLAVILVLLTQDTEAGLILLLLLKLLALKGALFFGMPLAIGSFMMGQGMGFFGGSMFGGYTMLDAARKYHHHHHKGKVTKVKDKIVVPIDHGGHHDPFHHHHHHPPQFGQNGPPIYHHDGPKFVDTNSGPIFYDNGPQIFGNEGGWRDSAAFSSSDWTTTTNEVPVISNVVNHSPVIKSKFVTTVAPPKIKIHSENYNPPVLRNFFSMPSKIIKHYRGTHKVHQVPISSSTSHHYHKSDSKFSPTQVWPLSGSPPAAVFQIPSPSSVAHHHHLVSSFPLAYNSPSFSLNPRDNYFESSSQFSTHVTPVSVPVTVTPIYKSSISPPRHKSRPLSFEPRGQWSSPPAHWTPAPSHASWSPAPPQWPSPPQQISRSSSSVQNFPTYFPYNHRSRDPALLQVAAVAGVAPEQVHKMYQIIEDPSHLTLQRRTADVPHEEKVQKEEEGSEKKPLKSPVIDQLLTKMRQLYIQELAHSVHLDETRDDKSKKGSTTELPPFKPIPDDYMDVPSVPNSVTSVLPPAADPNLVMISTTFTNLPASAVSGGGISPAGNDGDKYSSDPIPDVRPSEVDFPQTVYVLGKSTQAYLQSEQPLPKYIWVEPNSQIYQNVQNLNGRRRRRSLPPILMTAHSPLNAPPAIDVDELKEDLEKFFSLVSMLDQNKCLQKVVCDVHTRKSNLEQLNTYEKNIVYTLELLDIFQLNVKPDTNTFLYKTAAIIGGESIKSSGSSCNAAFPDCSYSTMEIIRMGDKVAAATSPASGNGLDDNVTG